MEEKKTTKTATAKKPAAKKSAKPAVKKTTKSAETKTVAKKTTKPAEKVEAAKTTEKKTVAKPATKKVETAAQTKAPATKKSATTVDKKVVEAKKTTSTAKETATKKVEAKTEVVKAEEKPAENVEELTKKTTTKTPAKSSTKTAAKKEVKAKEPKKKADKKTTTNKTAKTEKKQPAYEAVNFTLPGYKGLPLNVYLYDNTKNPKAVVILLHGMQEHSLRYKDFAEYLNKNDFIVVASDLRGHGLTAPSKSELGVGEEDIFAETINDQLNIINEIETAYNLPIYLFGHSYGSMLTQKLIQCSPVVEKAVLCGTASGNAGLIKLGNLLINIMSPFKNHNKRGGLVEKLCIKSYGKKFENGNWLTKDEAIFKAYQEDEYCGGSFPFSFYKSMLNNLAKVNNGIAKVGKKKVFFIAGDQDPVNNGGKDVVELHNFYLKNNIDSKIKLYKNDRHELLNETDKAEVWKDVVDFFNF